MIKILKNNIQRKAMPKERWSSALLLVTMGEEQAVPVCCTMLTEFLPTADTPEPYENGEQEWWFEYHRLRIARWLRVWQQPIVTSALRHALQCMIEAEPYLRDTGFCYDCEDAFAYELGYRKAFGALLGLPYLQFVLSPH